MEIRTRGLLTFIGFGSIYLLLIFWAAYPQYYPLNYYPSGLVLGAIIAMPGVASMHGFIEFASGKPIYELEAIWQSLKWWQRGFWGIIIVIFGGAIIFSVVEFALIRTH